MKSPVSIRLLRAIFNTLLLTSSSSLTNKQHASSKNTSNIPLSWQNRAITIFRYKKWKNFSVSLWKYELEWKHIHIGKQLFRRELVGLGPRETNAKSRDFIGKRSSTVGCLIIGLQLCVSLGFVDSVRGKT